MPTKAKRGKGQNKKGDKKKGNKKEVNSERKTSEVTEKASSENVLKKITLAQFKCDLHAVNWSDKTIDFYWAKHPKVGDYAVPVEGSLRVNLNCSNCD